MWGLAPASIFQIPAVGQLALKPRSGGMGKPGTVVPGRCKWNHPSPLQPTSQVCNTPTRESRGSQFFVGARAWCRAKPPPGIGERPVCPEVPGTLPSILFASVPMSPHSPPAVVITSLCFRRERRGSGAALIYRTIANPTRVEAALRRRIRLMAPE